MVKQALSFFLIFWCVAAMSTPVLATEPEQQWAATLYGAFLTGNSLEDVASLSAEYENSATLLVLALARQFASPNEDLRLEWEGQLVQHMGDQKHQEINALATVRWLTLPWDKQFDTSAAFGIGLSYATDVPELEQQNHKNTAKLLAYLLFEVEVAPESWDNYSLVLRTHHRSGAFGLFNHVHGASNAVGLGVKYRF